MAKSMTVGKRENEKKRLAKRHHEFPHLHTNFQTKSRY